MEAVNSESVVMHSGVAKQSVHTFNVVLGSDRFIEVYSFGFEQVGVQFLGAVLIVTGVFLKGKLSFKNN
jgi:hypothetical protein